MRLSSLQRMATGLSAAPARAPAQPARGHCQNVTAAAVGRGSSLATVAAKLVLLCAVGTGLVVGVNGQTLTTATSAASAAVATAAPLDIATPTSTTTADHHKHGSSSDSAPASIAISGSDVITSVAKPAAEPTTVSIWVPGYGVQDWSNLRGSIISSVGSLLSSTGSMVHVSARVLPGSSCSDPHNVLLDRRL